MTPRQHDYLRAIASEWERLGYAPIVREVATTLGVVTSTAWDAVNALERQGLVTRTANVSRSLRLTDAGRAALETGHDACAWGHE